MAERSDLEYAADKLVMAALRAERDEYRRALDERLERDDFQTEILQRLERIEERLRRLEPIEYR